VSDKFLTLKCDNNNTKHYIVHYAPLCLNVFLSTLWFKKLDPYYIFK